MPLPRPENRFLRAHFREYEFRHGADSAEFAHVQMSDNPIAAFEHRAGQYDLQLFIAVSRIVVQNSNTHTATNRFELTNSRRTFNPAIGWAIEVRQDRKSTRLNSSHA